MIRLMWWSSFALILWTYAGFPVLLLLRGALRRRPVRPAGITPRVSLVIVAHNEAATIGAKIENALALDYPADRLEVIIASDGSSDGTDAIVARAADDRIRLLSFPRAGKIPALNAAVKYATGDILAFSDANSMYEPRALRALVAPFADAEVGAVGGNQCYVPEPQEGRHGAAAGERLYWDFDRLLKTSQARAGNMTSATGAIHAIRRELFQPVPLGVSDDFVISTRAVLQGYRLAFAGDAIAYETVAHSPAAEFRRKLRVIVRGLLGLWVVRGLFNPLRYGFYSVQIFSHKLLRWSVCWLALVLFVTSLALYAAGAPYRLLTVAQLVFYGAAAIGWQLRNRPVRRATVVKPFSVAFYFVMANVAALRAWLQLLGGRRVDLWESARAVNAVPTT